MRELRKYGVDALFFLPAIDAGFVDFNTAPTLSAGDGKLFSYGGETPQINTNLAAEMVAFTSGSEEPANGDGLVGATSAATATFMFAVVTSGTWAGGTAAGFLFVKAVSGVFQSENINISGGTANVLTIGADTTAGLVGSIGNGDIVFACTASEMQCQYGNVTFIDSATKDWEDNKLYFQTFGHASAAIALDISVSNGSNFTEAGGTGDHLTALVLSAAGVDAIWDEDIVAAHGTSQTAGLLLRALGALIAARTNSPTLHALLAVPDTASVDLPDTIWNQVITLDPYTAAQVLNYLRFSNITAPGVVNDPGAVGTTTSVPTTLTGYGDNLFRNQLFKVTSGAQAGAIPPIATYTSATGVFTFDEGFNAALADGVTFQIVPAHVHTITEIQSGLASQASVDDVPTNAELATALASADDAVLAAIAALNNLGSADAQSATAAALAAYGAALEASLALTRAEIGKIHRSATEIAAGASVRYTQDASDLGNKTADVTIAPVP